MHWYSRWCIPVSDSDVNRYLGTWYEIARLKVSFLGPFYGGYNIIDLDHEAYQYVLVSEPDTSYLWVLARQPGLDDSIIDQLHAKASGHGFDISQKIFVAHKAPAQAVIQ